jgi:hypothetical protein
VDNNQILSPVPDQSAAKQVNGNGTPSVQSGSSIGSSASRLVAALRGRFQTAEARASASNRKLSDNDQAIGLAVDVYDALSHNGAKFSREDGGDVYFQLPNKEPVQIGKSVVVGSINHGLNALFVDRGFAPDGQVAKLATGFLQQIAYRASSSEASIKVTQFSAVSEDGKRLYVSQSQGMLGISADGIVELSSENIDRILVKPAADQRPFKFRTLASDEIKNGLALFEKLIVNTQSTVHKPMRWLVAMHATLFPFIRSAYQDRLILLLRGESGGGKSSGARRFSLLHGWKELWGDATEAALRNAGDVGIIFLDNKEQNNISRIEDWLLFASTGGETKRATRNGQLRKSSDGRPVVVVTSIEGFAKTETRNRTVEVEYSLTPAKISEQRAALEKNRQEITANRDLIMSALMYVVQRFLAESDSSAQEIVPDRVARAGDNYVAMCRLLRAYGELAGKDAGWSDRMIKMWAGVLDSAGAVIDEGLGDMVRNFIDALRSSAPSDVDTLIGSEVTRFKLAAPDLQIANNVTFKNQTGTLYVTHFDAMKRWAADQAAYRNIFPQNGMQFASRIREAQSDSLRVVKEGDLEHPLLKRQRQKERQFRVIGFFVPTIA